MKTDSESHSIALVLGASGLVGGQLVKQLLATDLYKQVILLTRRKLPLDHARLEQVVTDFSNLRSDLDDIEFQDVYCCLGTTMKKAGSKKAFRYVDYELPLMVCSAAKEKIRHFLLISALGANAGSAFFYNRVKGELEQSLRDIGLPFLTILRPSLLLGQRNETRMLESLGIRFARLARPMMIGPLGAYAPVEASSVAQAMVRAAEDVSRGRRDEAVLVLESEALSGLC